MAFFFSSASNSDEMECVFSTELKDSVAREDDVEEWRGGARQEPAHAPPAPTCHPLDDSATTMAFSTELSAVLAFFSLGWKAGMAFGVGLQTLKADSTETPPPAPSSPLLYDSLPPVSCR